MTLKYHIKPDIVTYWDVMKKKIMATRERMMQIMFETDNVLDMYMIIQTVLSPFALIRMTDLVMDPADDVCVTIPVSISYALPHTTLRLDLAGRDPQEYLMKITSEVEYSFDTTTESEIVYDIKEKMYHIVFDYGTKLKIAAENSDMEKTYEITDGNIITDDTERSRRQKVLFQANLSRGNKTFQAVDSFESRVFRLLFTVDPGRHCHSCIFFVRTETSQWRAQCKPKPRHQRTQTEAQRKEDDRYLFQETRYKIIMVENCKNIIEGMNEDRYETLHMTGYVKTFSGKTI